MGSRLRDNVQHLFECFCEVAAPLGEKPPWILQKYPTSFLDEEILKSVPKFAYPCEIENLMVQHFSFVLTSIDSKWTFGFCRHDPKTDTALVILSVLPWHEIFYKLLNNIATLMSNGTGEDLWKFLETVYKSPVPIPGSSISIPVPNSKVNFVCQSPKQFQLPSIPENVTNLKKALRNRSALLGDGVSRAFLRALVQLTAGYRDALTLEQGQSITFNQNAFVESRPSSMQPFLRKMLELQIFQQFIEERLNMLNSGLGFSDEFEMEACSYSAKSGSKFMQQYREWTYAMRKESSAFFRSVKDKVKDKGKDMKTAYKGLKWKGRSNRNDTSMRFHQPRSAPSSPTSDRRPIDFTSPPKSPNGFTATTSYRKDLRIRNSNFADPSRKQYSPLSPSSPEESDFPPERVNIDLMQELRHVIFPNTPPVDRTESPEVPDLIRLDSTTSNDDFDPLLSKSSEFASSKQMTQSLHIPEMGEGLSNPLYPYFQPLHKSNDKPQKSSDNTGDLDLLQAYGLDFNKFSISNGDSPSRNSTICNSSESSINIDSPFSLGPAIKSQNNWTKFE